MLYETKRFLANYLYITAGRALIEKTAGLAGTEDEAEAPVVRSAQRVNYSTATNAHTADDLESRAEHRAKDGKEGTFPEHFRCKWRQTRWEETSVKPEGCRGFSLEQDAVYHSARQANQRRLCSVLEFLWTGMEQEPSVSRSRPA